MAEFTIMTMCLLTDEQGRFLVQDVTTEQGWEGLTFPLTAVLKGESITGAAKRYFLEQLGLEIGRLGISGVVNWYNEKTEDRFIIFLLKVKSYKGELIPDLFEKRNFWATFDEMKDIGMAIGLEDYIRIYNDEDICEAFSIWSDERTEKLKIQ